MDSINPAQEQGTLGKAPIHTSPIYVEKTVISSMDSNNPHFYVFLNSKKGTNKSSRTTIKGASFLEIPTGRVWFCMAS